MPYNTFEKLAATLPYTVKPNPLSETQPQGSGPCFEPTKTMLKMKHLGNPAFGWFAVEQLTEARMRFPVFPDGNVNWVLLAYLWQMEPEKYQNNHTIAPVIRAWDIETNSKNRGTRAIMRAALIAEDASLEAVANALNLPQTTVEAYDTLFFNVLDRTTHGLYLRNIVYPNSRFEEFLDDYLQNTSLDTLLLRIGYNLGLDMVLYAAGMQQNPSGDMTLNQAASCFEEELLTTGYKLASSGLLNGKKLHPTIKATLAYIKASKARQTAGKGTSDQPSLVETMREQLAAAQ